MNKRTGNWHNQTSRTRSTVTTDGIDRRIDELVRFMARRAAERDYAAAIDGKGKNTGRSGGDEIE